MSSSRKKTKLCPRLRKPCIEDDCIDWVAYPAERVNELTGTKIVEPVYMCNEHWQTKIAFDNARMSDYTGAAVDSLRNQVAEGNATLGNLTFAAQRRLTNDNPR